MGTINQNDNEEPERLVAKEQSIDEESLRTLMCEFEEIINGGPITPTSDDPNVLDILTPTDLLLLRSENRLHAGIFRKDE